MKGVDFVKMGFKNLWRRKLRTILTVVGVAIGTFSIVIMMSLGIAMTEGYKEQLAEMGSLTKITVNNYSYNYDEKSGIGVSETKKLDDTLVEKLKLIKHVKGVTPIMNIGANLKSGKYQSYVSITGIDTDSMQYFDFPEIESGVGLSKENPTAVLFGKDSCYFYNPHQNGYRNNDEPLVNLIEDKVNITFDDTWDESKTPKYDRLQVAGIFAESSGEAQYSAYADISQVKKWYKESKTEKGSGSKKNEITYSQVWVSVDDVNNVEDVQQVIKDMGYGTYSLSDMLGEIQNISNMLQLILGGIGAVSLFVSAIGIANTMVMSIYERTKEIGVMKVLGCLVPDIRKLFLFEASIIGFLGGAIGILLSYGSSLILNKYAPMIGGALGLGMTSKISVIPVWLALISVAFAMFIGVISGWYPAKRATKIKALEAMRTES